jgi:hypothetical protein
MEYLKNLSSAKLCAFAVTFDKHSYPKAEMHTSTIVDA